MPPLMDHPDGKKRFVPREKVRLHLRHGWTVVDDEGDTAKSDYAEETVVEQVVPADPDDLNEE